MTWRSDAIVKKAWMKRQTKAYLIFFCQIYFFDFYNFMLLIRLLFILFACACINAAFTPLAVDQEEPNAVAVARAYYAFVRQQIAAIPHTHFGHVPICQKYAMYRLEHHLLIHEPTRQFVPESLTNELCVRAEEFLHHGFKFVGVDSTGRDVYQRCDVYRATGRVW